MSIRILATSLIYFSPCVTLSVLLLSVFICLPLTLSFSHNCVWTKGSFSIGLAATGGQRKGDRESKQWGGLADAPCYFSSDSHWLCQQWLALSRASKLRGAWQHALCNYQRELITGTLRRQMQEEVGGEVGGPFIIALPLFPFSSYLFPLDFDLGVFASFFFHHL